MATLVDLVKIVATSTGDGPITLGQAVSGFRGTEALVDGQQYSYSIQQGATYEYGRCTYVASGPQIVRSPLGSSLGGAPIPLTQNAQVSFVALSEDLDAVTLSNDAIAAAAAAAASEADAASSAAAAADALGELDNQVDLATAQANAAAISASAASVSAAVVDTLNVTPTALPYTVTGITAGSAGSGATVAGEFDLVISGGPAGHQAKVAVSGGAITGYRILNGGLSTSNAAPTYTLPTIAGLTGATAPTATVAALANGKTFTALSSDYLQALLWGVSSGVVAPVIGPNSVQVAFPLSAYVSKQVGALGVIGLGLEYERSGYADAVVDEDFRVLEGTTLTGARYDEGVRAIDLAAALAAKISASDVGLFAAPLEYERSGYADALIDEDFRVLEGKTAGGIAYVEGTRPATLVSDLASAIGLYSSQLEYERSGYADALFDEDFRVLEGTTTGGVTYIEGVRVSANGFPEAPTDGKTYGRANAAWAPISGAARAPFILIAAYDAPANIKAMADYVCSGVDDDVVIQGVINNLPVLPDRIITGCLVTGARGGTIVLSEGTFNCSNELTFPSGSVIPFFGAGLSADRYDKLPGESPTSTGTPQGDGGTVLYFTSASGRGLYWPRGVWPRVDDPSVTNEVPVSGIYAGGFHLYIKNPTVARAVPAVDCIGMATGRVKDIYAICLPRGASGGQKIQTGFAFNGGARSDMKEFTHCAASGFSTYGLVVNTTHLRIDQFSTNSIGGGTNPCGALITPDNGVGIGYIHCFGTGTGIRTTGSGQLHVEHADFEAVATPVVLADTSTPIHFSHVSSEQADTVWTGDLADYCIVDSAHRVGGLVRATGKITVPAGQTQATATLAMCGTPRRPPLLIPNSASGVGAWGTATKTQLTVNLSAVAAVDTELAYEVRCA